MTRPDFSKVADVFKSASLTFRNFFGQHKQRLLLVAGAFFLLVLLVVGFSLVGLAASRGRRNSMVDAEAAQGFSLEGVSVVRDLYMPGPAVGETPFPLAFEPDPGYTDQGLRERYNDMKSIDVRDLTAKRKAELEAIYETLD
jgi:hypothetical protein